MSIPADYRDIVVALLDKTDQGAVHWRQDKFDIGVSFEGSKFSLWAGHDDNTEEPFVAFALQDDKGATLDSWYVEEHDGTDYTMVHRLYQSAKRHAAGVPEKLRALREKIAAAKEIGSPPDQ
jgi:hypothetical protein